MRLKRQDYSRFVLKVIALVIPLGLDSFAICAALGLSGIDRGQRLRVSILFPAFEAGMPVLGLVLGAPLGNAIGGVADYIAAAVLFAFGLMMLIGIGERGEEERVARLATTHGMAIVGLGLGIALDELAIGFTIGLLGLPLVPTLSLIAAQAIVFSQLGLRLGARLNERIREYAERLAGLALIAIGMLLLLEKLLSG
jgi:putative Mn2+ efflux pump MntP